MYHGFLFIGGKFTEAGGDGYARYLARWDGSNLGGVHADSPNDWVNALTVYNDDLIVGGNFDTVGVWSRNKIAAWHMSDKINGYGEWEDSLGPGVMGGGVSCLTVYDDELIAGGWFSSAGGVLSESIARWNGSIWQGLGLGASDGGEIMALTTRGGYLIAGGEFEEMDGDTSIAYVAMWSAGDLSWYDLRRQSLPGVNGTVTALDVYDMGFVDLVVGGNFTTAGDQPANHIAMWTGFGWGTMGSGMNNTVYAFAEYNGELVAAGSFTTADGATANRIARYSSGRWFQLSGSGMNGPVYAFTEHDFSLIAGGNFTTADGDTAHRVAKWVGVSWQPLGGGMDASVAALTVYNDWLVAAGYFNSAGGIPTEYIAWWNAEIEVWDKLGPQGFDTNVYALTVYNGELIAGGIFANAGFTLAEGVARWNWTSWDSMGSGLYYSVKCFTEYNGDLIAGGSFTSTSNHQEYAGRVARWTGTAWERLGSGIDNGQVLALTVYDGELIAGGTFAEAGGVSFNHIAKWNGTTWDSLGLGVNGFVSALTVYNNELITGGDFLYAGGTIWQGGTRVRNIAKWNGAVWEPLGSGVSGSVKALTVYNDELIVGGQFTMAGGKAANYIAVWNRPGGSPTPCCEGIRGNVDDITGSAGDIDVADLAYLTDYVFKGGSAPPCEEEGNVDGVTGSVGPMDVADIIYLIFYLFKDGPAPPPCP